MENIVLNNKLECPVVGIGTFMLSSADAENSVREALKMGYETIVIPKVSAERVKGIKGIENIKIVPVESVKDAIALIRK